MLRCSGKPAKADSPKTARSPLQAFGSVKRIRRLDEEALAAQVGPAKARTVAGYFAPDETKEPTPKAAA